MYFFLKKDCFFRKYDDIGYITRPALSLDEVVNEIGAIFIGKLGYEPKCIDDIAQELLCVFDNVEFEDLKNDILEFYFSLVSEGFLDYSENIENINIAPTDYSTLQGKLDYKPIKTQLQDTSAHFLNEYLKENPHLVAFQIELTSKCNERCIHCYIPHETKNTSIDYNMMIDVIDQCKKMDVLTLIFSGGEPMLHPNFCDFVKYAKDLDINVTVLTNLTLLTDEIIEVLAYKHPTCVNVSLYSMIAEVHDSITTIRNSFEITKNNILKLIKNNIPVKINCPVMKQNKDSFYEVIKWGHLNNCTVVTDYLIVARSDGSIDNLDNRLSKLDLEDVIKNLVQYDLVIKKHIQNLNVAEENVETSENDKVCGVGLSTLCMDSCGSVYPCVGWNKYLCGNLKNESLKNIWDNSPLVNYLRTLRQKDFQKCLKCNDKEFCAMCMCRNSNEDPNGDLFNIPQITCDAAHIHHKVVKDFISSGGME